MKSCIIVLDILILVIAFKNGQCCDTECSFSEWKEESICHDGVAKWSRTICCKSNPHDLTKCLAACKVSLEDLEKIENCKGIYMYMKRTHAHTHTHMLSPFHICIFFFQVAIKSLGQGGQ